MTTAIHRLSPLPLLLVLALSCTAFAGSSHDRTQVGHDISIAPAEEVSEVTCFGCSIRISGHVAGDATAFGGSIIVEDGGTIGGDTTIFGGNLRLNSNTNLNGDVTVFGGRMQRDPESHVGGDVTNFGGRFWLPFIFVFPLIALGGFIALIVLLVRRLTRGTTPVAA